MWSFGDLNALLEEGRSIQCGLTCRRISSDSSNVSLSFSKLMLQGRVCAALRLLSDHDNGPFATGQDDRDKVFQGNFAR